MSIRDKFPIDQWDFQSETILSGLPAEEIGKLMNNATEHSYKKGEIIFRENAYPAGIFYIIDGKVKKYKLDKDGRENIIYVANSGELIGYHAILADERYPDSTATLTDARIAFIPKEDFIAVLETSKELSKKLLKTLSHEFAVLTNNLGIFSQRPAIQRLAIRLITLREKYKNNYKPGDAVEIEISREDLSNLVGIARENVIRLLSQFKTQGIIETGVRNIVILDIEKLISIADI